MRRAYLVTYDYKGSSEQYAPLFDELKKSIGWWHYIANSWLIIAEGDAKEILARLKPHLDNDINLLVIEVGKDRQGWLPKKAWDWIKKNLPKYGLNRPE